MNRRARIAARRSGQRERLGQPRSLRVETLESRRLLIAQGEVFEFTRALDTSGLLGDVSAQIQWGDDSASAATSIVGGNPTGNLQIVFDYSLDTSGFFNSASRRNLLHIAADSLISRLTDELTAIQPSVDHRWNVSIMHPSARPPGDQDFVDHRLPAGPAVAANTILVYAGARDLPGSVRGIGGAATSISIDPVQFACQTQAECDQKLADFEVFRDAVVARGNTGGLIDSNPKTDFAPGVGSISFDNSGTDWYFGLDETEFPGGNTIDFLSVATHELAHVLGFGVAPSWQRLAGGTRFSGTTANAAYLGSGNVPLQAVASGTSSHWNQSVLDFQPSLMTGTLVFAAGQRTEFSALDFAGLEDIGWEPVDMQATVTGNHRYLKPGTFTPQVVLTGSRSGQIIHTLAPVTVTAVTQVLTASFASSQVREDSTAGVALTITRGDLDTSSPLSVNISGGPSGQLAMPTEVTIAANQSQHVIQILPINDTQAELAKELSFTFTAVNHQTATASIIVLDDEPPQFQNPLDRFDVAGEDGPKASDALRIINELLRRGGESILDPEQEQPGNVFFDVNGDYQLTALDALQVINELARMTVGETTVVAQSLWELPKSPVKIDLDDQSFTGKLF